MNQNTTPIPPQPSKLYLRLSDSRICFARYEKRQQEPVFDFSLYHIQPQVSLHQNLRDAIGTEALLQAPIEETVVLVSTPITLMPLADFQEEDCNTIYNYCFPQQPGRIFYDIIPAANAVLMFSLNELICQDLEQCFTNVKYISAQTPMLRRFSTKGLHHQVQKRLFVYRHEKSIDVAIFEGSRLIMANSYTAINDDDVAYYVLNLVQQQSMDNGNSNIYVAGNPVLRENASNKLREFISNVYIIHPSADFNRHPVAMHEHMPYDMMALLLD